MAPSIQKQFLAPLSITYIGTATAILHIHDINLITDPFFSPEGTEWDVGIMTLRNTDTPALGLADLPPIDAVLLSHEDHADNLDELGRLLLDGRRVLTTVDGASKLAPRPGVVGIKPWETVQLNFGGRQFSVTGTPCSHLPGGEVTGFILTGPSFGSTNGKPNAIYFSGDTIHAPELDLVRMTENFHISVALLNIGKAVAPLPDGPLQITMDGVQAAKLFREIEADVLVPMHYESWGHFSESRAELEKAFEREGVTDKVLWLVPGKETELVGTPAAQS